MKEFMLSSNLRQYLWWILAFTLIVRLFTMQVFPLTDNTEARYGEIARKMLETNNWVTLQNDYGVPFWAKPPLSIWGSAISMKVFGMNEFAARLPSLFFMLGITWMVWYLGKARHNKDFGLFSSVILFTLPLFFITSGAVMTDASLAFSVCLSFTTFWLGINENIKTKQRLYGYLFFIGLGLGLLAKGLICLVLVLPPIIIWQFTQGNWSRFWSCLPLINGSIIMLLIAAPWYILAEYRTPGFLNYFIVGEHFQRFLIPNWSGDQYGHAHSEPIGMIWLFMFLAIFPWALIIIYWFMRNFKKLNILFHDKDGWLHYLFWWTIWPLLFFTMARNIIISYVITTLPSLVLLIVEIWSRNIEKMKMQLSYKTWLLISLLAPTIFIFSMMMVLLYNPNVNMMKTQKLIVQKYKEQRVSRDSQIYYYNLRTYSAQFYTGGLAKTTTDIKKIKDLLANNTKDFLVVKKADSLPKYIVENFVTIGTYGRYTLLEEKTTAAFYSGYKSGSE